MREYLICSPAWADICGGIKSLHYLAHKLNEREGITAYVTGGRYNPNFNTPKATDLIQEHLRDLQHNGIIVYPDIIAYNPCRFTHCVKWWMGVSQPPPIHHLVFTFAEAHDVVHKYDNHLCAVYFEDFFKYPEVENRKDACCYVGKGAGGFNTINAPEIGPQFLKHPETDVPGCYRIQPGHPARREELARVLQTREVFYSYDNLTIMNTEARLCGCPVILMGHWTISPESFAKDTYSTYAVGMYSDKPDTEKLREELPLFQQRFIERQQQTEIEIDNFIDLTQNWNKENKYVEDLDPTGYFQHKIYGHKEFELWATR